MFFKLALKNINFSKNFLCDVICERKEFKNGKIIIKISAVPNSEGVPEFHQENNVLYDSYSIFTRE